MKNTTILAVILSAFIFASCGTSHDVVDGGLFQKRKYNKGYHVSKKGKVSSSKTDNESEVAAVVEIENVDLKSNSIIHEPITTSQSIATDKSVGTLVATTSNDIKVVEEKKVEKNSSFDANGLAKNNRNMSRKGLSTFISDNPLSLEKSDNTSQDQNTTDNTLLLVIIAFFIPFLAVGLYDGITGRFWLSLILTFLFWLPGFIYALIVILE